MKQTPFYLTDTFMTVYRASLMFSFLLGFSSIIVGIFYAVIISSFYLGFLLFIKVAAITAILSFIGIIGLWKKHQLNFEEQKTKGDIELGFFSLS